MKLYHGSNIVVDNPEITKGKPYKDFGQGFYLSDTIEQAKEMAQRVVERIGASELLEILFYAIPPKQLQEIIENVKSNYLT